MDGRVAFGEPLQIGFGPIRHRRLRPVEHAFGYPGVFLRLRIDGDAARDAARPLGRWFGWEARGALSFRAADHGDGRTPLEAWIRGLCAQAGVSADGPVWLHCFPRMLGFAFKPVSFWYCHRVDGALVAIVAEVNNTFGERHCYLLAEPGGAPLVPGRELRAAKVFHVSPFCSVEGDYAFRFVTRADRALMRVDHHDADGPLLLTSLSGELVRADRAAARRALLGTPLFTLGVVARIHWQALRLWLARVPFHRKPEPPEAFVTRGRR
ncbi:MAG TPA: DUF1365 domain-containing protein [Burkholderiaceae bacterium]|nr:DUF1365 domain-containing protein [Burkholderiaceae bacterium]